MLDLKKCRDLLGENSGLSDKEIELLRTQMYWLADILLDMFSQKVYLIIFSPYNLILVEESAILEIVEA